MAHPAQASQYASPFLRLPVEVRLIIYEYALTSPTGIQLRFKRGKNSHTLKPCMMAVEDEEPDKAISINQLGYVNREIRREAAGLETLFNRVTFKRPSRSSPDITAMDDFCTFVVQCTTRKRQWLKHALVIPEPDTSSALAPNGFAWFPNNRDVLVKFFNTVIANPHIRVDLNMPFFTLKPEATRRARVKNLKDIICAGVILLWLFRKVDRGQLCSRYLHSTSVSLKLRGVLNPTYLDFVHLCPQATNLRIFLTTKELDGCLSGAGEDWCAAVRNWVQNGI